MKNCCVRITQTDRQTWRSSVRASLVQL